MGKNSTPRISTFVLHGALGGLFVFLLLIGVLCQGCSVQEEARTVGTNGRQISRSNGENRKRSTEFNSVQYRNSVRLRNY